jgi:hypothetical protein
VRWLFTISLASLTLLISASLAVAQNQSPGFGMQHVETGLTHIELTLAPGESEEFTLRHFTRDESTAEVVVFPSNVYTVRGGGMGVNDIDHPRSGATTWFDLVTTDLTLEPDESVEQTITISVPEDASPGEYATAIVSMSADEQNGDTGDPLRQVVPVYIDIPGERTPEMELDGVEHRVVEDQSVVDIRLLNSGNVHLRPEGTFALRSISGDTLAETAIGLDTVYARTPTRIEITFTNELPSGEYLISLSLRDDITGANVETDDLSVIVGTVESTPESTPAAATSPDQTDDADNGGIVGSIRGSDLPSGGTPGMQAMALGGLAIVFIIVLVVTLIIRMGPPAPASPQQPVRAAHRNPSIFQHEPPPRQPERHRPIRQLVPPGRAQ